jgi:ribosomal protection tetracycline resistance protein
LPVFALCFPRVPFRRAGLLAIGGELKGHERAGVQADPVAGKTGGRQNRLPAGLRVCCTHLADEAAASYPRLRAGLAEQTRAGRVHPVFFGSAITGAGTGALAAGLTRLLPAAGGDADGPVSARVFKVERGPAGEKIAWVRMFSGTVSVRDRVRFGPPGRDLCGRGKVTAVATAGQAGRSTPAAAVTAGQIGRLWGLAGIQIGDQVAAGQDAAGQDAAGQDAAAWEAAAGLQFAPPALETAVLPGQPGAKAALRLALTQLAEQDVASGRADGS